MDIEKGDRYMKYRNPFIIPLVIITLVIGMLLTPSVYAQSKSDYKIAKAYCQKYYPTKTIRVFTKYNAKRMEHRKGTKYVYVEKFTSYSKGRYGYSKKGEYVRYNKYVKKGKKVVSYFVYNPYTNYCDDVVVVIDCGKIR